MVITPEYRNLLDSERDLLRRQEASQDACEAATLATALCRVIAQKMKLREHWALRRRRKPSSAAVIDVSPPAPALAAPTTASGQPGQESGSFAEEENSGGPKNPEAQTTPDATEPSPHDHPAEAGRGMG